MFVGRAQRPTWHFSFKNVAAREKRIAETFESVVQRNVGKAVARAVKKQFVNPYKVGDLFKSGPCTPQPGDRKSTRLNSSHQIISYAVFSLKKKTHDPLP